MKIGYLTNKQNVTHYGYLINNQFRCYAGNLLEDR